MSTFFGVLAISFMVLKDGGVARRRGGSSQAQKQKQCQHGNGVTGGQAISSPGVFHFLIFKKSVSPIAYHGLLQKSSPALPFLTTVIATDIPFCH